MLIAARKLTLNHGCISKCVKGRRRQTGGYEFRLSATTPEQLPGEVWRDVDLVPHNKDRAKRNRLFRRSPKVLISIKDMIPWKVAKPLKACPKETGFGKVIGVGQLYCNYLYDLVILVNFLPPSITFDWCKNCVIGQPWWSTKEWICTRVLWFQIDSTEHHTPWKRHSSTKMMYNKIIQLCQGGNRETYQKRELLKAVRDKCPGCSRNDCNHLQTLEGFAQAIIKHRKKDPARQHSFSFSPTVEL